MYGFDIESRFSNLSLDLYHDRDRWEGKIFPADGTKDLDSPPWGKFKGEVDVVWCPKHLHLYDREHQVPVACNLVQLLRSQAGNMFVGSQNGLQESEETPLCGRGFEGQQETFFIGNDKTIKEIWAEVARRTGTKWNIDARLVDLRTIGLHKDDGTLKRRRRDAIFSGLLL
jgi:hypothetical protein